MCTPNNNPAQNATLSNSKCLLLCAVSRQDLPLLQQYTPLYKEIMHVIYILPLLPITTRRRMQHCQTLNLCSCVQFPVRTCLFSSTLCKP